VLREYCEGNRSLGSFAKALDVSLSEAINFLAHLGVRSPIEYDGYLTAYATASGFVRGQKKS